MYTCIWPSLLLPTLLPIHLFIYSFMLKWFSNRNVNRNPPEGLESTTYPKISYSICRYRSKHVTCNFIVNYNFLPSTRLLMHYLLCARVLHSTQYQYHSFLNFLLSRMHPALQVLDVQEWGKLRGPPTAQGGRWREGLWEGVTRRGQWVRCKVNKQKTWGRDFSSLNNKN